MSNYESRLTSFIFLCGFNFIVNQSVDCQWFNLIKCIWPKIIVEITVFNSRTWMQRNAKLKHVCDPATRQEATTPSVPNGFTAQEWHRWKLILIASYAAGNTIGEFLYLVVQNNTVREVCYSTKPNYADTDGLLGTGAIIQQEWHVLITKALRGLEGVDNTLKLFS